MVRDESAALNDLPTIAAALRSGIDAIEAISDSPRLDAELLLARAVDVPRSYVIAHPDDTLDAEALRRFEDTVARRAAGEPMAYITGSREFWSMELMVTPATLVPRPETELLVEQAIGHVSRREAQNVLDLGTGSGAIALAIARERPLASVVATDRSEDALAVARQNARQLDVANVEFRAGDWVAPVADMTFDVIVSNPPYVRDADPALDSLAFEPRDALAAGADGLDAIRRIAVDALGVVAADGLLLVEHGADQAEDVAAIFSDAGWREVRNLKDLAGLPRVTAGRAPQA